MGSVLHCIAFQFLFFFFFYFTDPPAPDAGTWPKQLHSNNLEHLSLARKVNIKWRKLCVNCVCVCDCRELWHAVWPSGGGGDSSGGQAPGCWGAVCVQHDCAGDRWDQLRYGAGTGHTRDLLRTGATSRITSEPHQIKLLLPLPGGAVYSQRSSLPTLALPFLVKLSLADYEICFLLRRLWHFLRSRCLGLAH